MICHALNSQHLMLLKCISSGFKGHQMVFLLDSYTSRSSMPRTYPFFSRLISAAVHKGRHTITQQTRLPPFAGQFPAVTSAKGVTCYSISHFSPLFGLVFFSFFDHVLFTLTDTVNTTTSTTITTVVITTSHIYYNYRYYYSSTNLSENSVFLVTFSSGPPQNVLGLLLFNILFHLVIPNHDNAIKAGGN
ncbi:hypothetical protein CSKR_201462 [Clonorchis sinensis]|uniref:Uncharacterized protein n=1 Tax=Clonorchis sinensis TaxID=79923 RepID=A0A8T1MRU3_CLOSI|nr:hypothetical protein CSKR_201462 [Clonorchis sinensis]